MGVRSYVAAGCRRACALAAFGILSFVAAGSAATLAGNTAWTLAGTGVAADSGDGGQAREADINQPRSIFPTQDGGYVWAEPWSNRVRKVDGTGIVSTVAGNGSQGYGGDGGQATAATLNFVHSASPTPDGGYLLADTQNSRIRKVSPSGVIATVAGDGSATYGGDGGPATAASINNPRGVVALADGSFLIPDSNNHRVRKVSPAGIITTVAGTGTQGFSGDNGPATSANLSIPFGVAPTPDGGFLIVDVGNQRIRKVSASGTITTVAGTGTAGYSGDGGPATQAMIANPHNVVADSAGGFYIADASNERVRYVSPGGTISSPFGTGVRGYSGDGGNGTSAQLAVPKAVGITASGDLMVADEQNSRVRFLGTVVTPANTVLPALSGTPAQGQSLSGTAGGWGGTGPTFTYQWLRCDVGGGACANIAGATNKTYVLTSADVGSTIRLRVTASNSSGSTAASSLATSVVGSPLVPPSNTSPPTVSGTPGDGQTLTANDGTWSGSLPMTFSYQWRRCNAQGGSCAPIAGATSKTYVVVSADIGSTLKVGVSATNGAGSSTYASTVNADNPSSYWRLGDLGTTASDSRGSAVGTYVGSPQQGVTGLPVGDVDKAVTLSGSSQYVEIPASTAWTPGAFSVELLVRSSSLPDNRTIAAVQGQFTGWWLNTDTNGQVRFFIGDGSAWRYAAPIAALPPGTTKHIVATYDAGVSQLYVDGTLVATGPFAVMSPNLGANTLRFGSASSFVGQFWPGTMDDVSFYPVALSATQVSAHASAALTAASNETLSAATAVVAATPPTNTALPMITGTAEAGQTLSVSQGTWAGSTPMSFTYQWRRCDASGNGCANISGATSSTYLLVSGDVGSTVRAVVTATNGAGPSSATSAQSAVVAAQQSSGTMTFSVQAGSDDGDLQMRSAASQGYPPTGNASASTSGSVVTAGRRLAFNNYSVLVPLLRFDTSGLPDGATITSATLKLYASGKADGDNRSLMAEWYPASSWPIDAADYSLDSTGTALAGSDITAITTGAVNNFALSGLSSVSTTGLTALRLHVSGGAPSGDNYVQLASFENANPEPQLVVSYQTGAATPPSNTALPVISGTAEAGQTLTVSQGSWSGTVPMSFTYQWRRCDAAGNGCANIAGGTSSSYTLVAADVGSTVRAVVTATNGAGSSAATSAPSAVVASQPTSGTLTFSVTTGTDDGDLQTQSPASGGYPPSSAPSPFVDGTLFTAGRRLAFGNYGVIVPLLRFDTSALPDGATITAATLKLHVTGKADADNRSLMAEWYAASNWPIDAADYSLDSTGSALAGSDITSITAGAVNSFTLTGLSSVSTTGLTALRLHLSGGVPAGDNYVQFASFESANPEPQLVVSYSTGPPTPPSNTALPVISGAAEAGQTLSVSQGSWSGTTPMSSTYQWRRCDAAGNGCSDIPGATSSTYLLISGDVGSTVRAVVTATNGAGSSSATSAQSAVVAAQPSSGTTTFSLLSGSDDGDLQTQSPASGGYPPSGSPAANVGGTVITAGRRLAFGNYGVLVPLLRFDTSALPDGATITSVTLKVYVTAKTDSDNRNLMAEWYPASSWPIDAADYALDSTGTALAGSDITAITVGAVNNFALTGLSSVSTTGSTALRLHVSGGAPTGDNYVQLASFENGNPAAQLVVSWTVP